MNLAFAIVYLIILLISSAHKCVVAKEIYNFQEQVALVTGGAQGIGFGIVCDLLNRGVRGVTVVDINAEKGIKAAKLLNQVFGNGKAIFVQADVSNADQFENAFRISTLHWKGLDIVINNAGVNNENNWKLVLNVNAIGTLQGTLLGFKYMGNSNKRREKIIINVASVAGIDPAILFPIYSASKNFVIGLGRALGSQVYYDYNKIRIITLCPGGTNTSLLENANTVNAISRDIHPNLIEIAEQFLSNYTIQSANAIGRGVTYILENGSNGSVWVVEDEEIYEVVLPDRKSMRKDTNIANYG